jgi:hypothetical protein
MTALSYFLTAIAGAIIGILVMALLQVNRKPELPVPVWYETAKRPPTEEDADEFGNVWAAVKHGRYEAAREVHIARVAYVPQLFPYWTRTPGMPKEATR